MNKELLVLLIAIGYANAKAKHSLPNEIGFIDDVAEFIRFHSKDVEKRIK